ncbi:potassium transporter TrkG [Pacificibacter sp. AS14]|uniref:TrkH family potassium uptake protein n=1 Tax=Pacificibacter sp. AS14 TaxID=3135785 RepID=UPI003172ABFC
MNRFSRMPFFIQLMLICSGAMMVPAIYGGLVSQFLASRSFFYSGILFGTLACLVAITRFRGEATEDRDTRKDRDREGRNQLLVLLAAYTVLPVILAVPFSESIPNTTFFNAYFEMVSALTTTGATVFEDPNRLPTTVHLWISIVGWLGGLFAWVTAIAVLAPLNLGGFEVIAARAPTRGDMVTTGASQIVQVAAGPERLSRYTQRLFPIYLGLTLVLWFALAMTGATPFVALCHAMSTMATSGISPVGGFVEGHSNFGAELLVFAFLTLALSRKTFTIDQIGNDVKPLRRDSEIKIALVLLIGLPIILFLRHWSSALEVSEQSNLVAVVQSLWGSAFMVMSFLTTTGFESSSWDAARLWSGLQAPGVLLFGLAVFGGGVATTAGGVKLLRLYALVRHSEREIEKMISPNSVGGAGATARRLRRQGAYVAWVYFMLFALTIAVVMMALSLFGLHFEAAAVFTVSALTTTGPLVYFAAEVPFSYADLDTIPKAILAATMVLGRLEMLAIVALLNPEFWRR